MDLEQIKARLGVATTPFMDSSHYSDGDDSPCRVADGDIAVLIARVEELEAALIEIRPDVAYIKKDLEFCIRDDGVIHSTEVLTSKRILDRIAAALKDKGDGNAHKI